MRALALVVLVGSAFGMGWPVSGEGSPEGLGLAFIPDYVSLRASSADPTGGNADARRIEPGAALTLAELEGPGVVTHIWFTIAAEERYYPRLLLLRIFWDGEENPSVLCPVGDFFCVGHGLDEVVDNAFFQVGAGGRARNCFIPMPFYKSARIEVVNEGKRPVGAFYYYIDWRRYRRLPEGLGRFHALYRQEFPCIGGREYLILDARGRGHYVGMNLSVRQRTPSWWGEGDDHFFIDGAQDPQLSGTGSEDYLCQSWGVHPGQFPYFGTTVYEGYEAGSRHTNYRLHVADPVAFTSSLRVTIEHMGVTFKEDGSFRSGFEERADDFASVAYWYQEEPHAPHAPLPPGAERLPVEEVAVIEGESLLPPVVSNGGPCEAQHLGVGWSGGAQVFFRAAAEGGYVELELEWPLEGTYDLAILLTRSYDYGIVEVALDGEVLGRVDCYDPQVRPPRVLRVKDVQLTPGPHRLRLTAVGRNRASAGYYIGLDGIIIEKER